MNIESNGRTSAARGLLSDDRAILKNYMPELYDHLSSTPLLTLESPNNGSIDKFREANGTALLVPKDLSGSGASAVDAIRVQRAIGSLSPSLAAGTTMHHLSLATLIEYCAQASADERLLAMGLVQERALLASGFSEGRSGSSVFAPTMQARRKGTDYVINGSKKPCSLSRSMDMLIATVQVTDDTDETSRAIALIPANTSGISRKPFWDSWILAGSQSDEVVLKDVTIPVDLVMVNDDSDPDGQHEMTGFLWFGLMISATYVGAASALLERMLLGKKQDPHAYVAAAAEVEGAMSALEGLARAMDAGERGDDITARMLLTRYAIQGAVVRATATAVEALGGMSFIRSSEISYLAATCHAMGFHPPNRKSTAEALTAYHAGHELVLS